MTPDKIDPQFVSYAVIMGALIGLGQVLDSEERLTWRIVAGRALVSAGLASMAPVLLTLFPAMPISAQFAAAALFASAGTSGLQTIVRAIMRRKL